MTDEHLAQTCAELDQENARLHGELERLERENAQLHADRLKAEHVLMPVVRAARAFIDDPRGVRSDLPTWVSLRHFVEKVGLP